MIKLKDKIYFVDREKLTIEECIVIWIYNKETIWTDKE